MTVTPLSTYILQWDRHHRLLLRRSSNTQIFVLVLLQKSYLRMPSILNSSMNFFSPPNEGFVLFLNFTDYVRLMSHPFLAISCLYLNCPCLRLLSHRLLQFPSGWSSKGSSFSYSVCSKRCCYTAWLANFLLPNLCLHV